MTSMRPTSPMPRAQGTFRRISDATRWCKRWG
jgi:hypothetical protein